MSIDVSRLTPAPWEADYGHYHEGATKTDICSDEAHLFTADFGQETDAEFCALARNAFAGDPEALAWWEANRVRREPTT